jgi:hypothetical protein
MPTCPICREPYKHACTHPKLHKNTDMRELGEIDREIIRRGLRKQCPGCGRLCLPSLPRCTRCTQEAKAKATRATRVKNITERQEHHGTSGV